MTIFNTKLNFFQYNFVSGSVPFYKIEYNYQQEGGTVLKFYRN